MEPLRPALEQWVVSLFNGKWLEKRHFSTVQEQCLLGKEGREVFYQQWQQVDARWVRKLDRWALAFARHLDSMAAIERGAAPMLVKDRA